MAYTNFCARLGGSNLNAGTRTGNTTVPGTAADFTYASGTYVQATRVFTVASGNPQSDGVAVGDWIALDTTGSAPATFGGRVTAVSTTTITVSATAAWGTNPADGTYTLRVGGAWAGPSGTGVFPFTLATMNSAVNAAADPVRINFMSDLASAMTAGINQSTQHARVYEGFTAAYGDGGFWTLDGGTSGASYALFTMGPAMTACKFKNIVFKNNGATGSAAGVTQSANGIEMENCVVRDFRGHGVTNSAGLSMIRCEVFGCNQSNTVNTAGVNNTSALHMHGCLIHDNTGSNTVGLRIGGGSVAATYCVFESNGSHGATAGGSTVVAFTGCDFYNNGGSGVLYSQNAVYFASCNFIDNALYGVGAAAAFFTARKCGFGSGTAANGSGDVQSTIADVTGSVTYASNTTPYTDPANGDFRISLAAAKGAGEGSFTQTAASYAGAVGYPDIGSCQHLESAASGGIAVINWG